MNVQSEAKSDSHVKSSHAKAGSLSHDFLREVDCRLKAKTSGSTTPTIFTTYNQLRPIGFSHVKLSIFARLNILKALESSLLPNNSCYAIFQA
jgi:hypothetical protein